MARSGAGCLLLLSSAALAQPVAEWPAEWNLISDNTAVYTAAVDRSTAHDGVSSALLSSGSLSGPGYAILYQITEASGYRGKRVRYSAYLKTREVHFSAGLWFRVDDINGKNLAFDVMEGSRRRLRGDADWKWYSIVIDVPASGANLLYGVALTGSGMIWTDGVSIEIVDQSVPVTARRTAQGIKLPQSGTPSGLPRNLDFEKGVLLPDISLERP